MQIFEIARAAGWGELVVTGLSESCLSGRLHAAAGAALAWFCSEAGTSLCSPAINAELRRRQSNPIAPEQLNVRAIPEPSQIFREARKGKFIETKIGSKPISGVLRKLWTWERWLSGMPITGKASLPWDKKSHGAAHAELSSIHHSSETRPPGRNGTLNKTQYKSETKVQMGKGDKSGGMALN